MRKPVVFLANLATCLLETRTRSQATCGIGYYTLHHVPHPMSCWCSLSDYDDYDSRSIITTMSVGHKTKPPCLLNLALWFHPFRPALSATPKAALYSIVGHVWQPISSPAIPATCLWLHTQGTTRKLLAPPSFCPPPWMANCACQPAIQPSRMFFLGPYLLITGCLAMCTSKQALLPCLCTDRQTSGTVLWVLMYVF